VRRVGEGERQGPHKVDCQTSGRRPGRGKTRQEKEEKKSLEKTQQTTLRGIAGSALSVIGFTEGDSSKGGGKRNRGQGNPDTIKDMARTKKGDCPS